MKIIALIALLTLVGCAAASTQGTVSSCPSAVSTTPKDLFSTWYRQDCKETLTLNGGVLNYQDRGFTFSDSTGVLCTCSATLCGTTAAGSYLFTGCTASSGATGCSSVDGVGGSYTLTGNQLTICNSSTCTVYR